LTSTGTQQTFTNGNGGPL